MSIKKILGYALLCAGLFALWGCSENSTTSNDPDGGETGEVTKNYDWRLEGKWKYASDGENDFPWTFVFEKDGKGTYDGGKLTWYCYNNHLYVDFDNGKSIKDCNYILYGATLQLDNPSLSYILDSPYTGSWLAAGAHDHFTGSVFYYTFTPDGNAECFTFNASGIWESQKYSWFRIKDGIQLQSGATTKNIICQADKERLSVDGEGEFDHTSPFYGQWKSVCSQNGAIHEGDEEFSTIELYPRDDRDYFIYYEKDSKYARYQGSMMILLYNRALYVKSSVDGNETFLYFRFYYSKDTEKVYLELSRGKTFAEYTRYEFVKAL